MSNFQLPPFVPPYVPQSSTLVGSNGTTKSLGQATAIATHILQSGPFKNIEDVACATMKYMSENFPPARQDQIPPGRDACSWPTSKILATKNIYGCVESAKVFLALFQETARLAQFSYNKCEYVSSFSTKWAEENRTALLTNKFPAEAPPGHALVRLSMPNGKTILIDAAQYQRIGDNRTQSPEEFKGEKRDAVIQQHLDGSVSIRYEPWSSGPQIEEKKFSTITAAQADLKKYGIRIPQIFITPLNENSWNNQDSAPTKYQGTYIIFDPGKSDFIQQENKSNLLDPNTTNGATLNAMIKYLQK